MTEKNTPTTCRLCKGKTAFQFSKELLGKFQAEYLLCDTCDLLQTSEPIWLQDAYSKNISSKDVGAMQRNKSNIEITLGLIRFLGLSTIKDCLDFGGGIGIFTRCMRDEGVSYYWQDKYSENLLAQGFSIGSRAHFDLVTAFEVWEHLVKVEEEFDTLFSLQPKFIFGQTLLRWNLDKNWWYLSPETGQHISFYSPKTLEWIAKKFGYKVYHGHSQILFVHPSVRMGKTKSMLLEKLLYRPQLLALFNRLAKSIHPLKSLTEEDSRKVFA